MNKTKKPDMPSNHTDLILIRVNTGQIYQQASSATHLVHTRCHIVYLELSDALPALEELIIHKGG